jgi:hypothetical protein
VWKLLALLLISQALAACAERTPATSTIMAPEPTPSATGDRTVANSPPVAAIEITPAPDGLESVTPASSPEGYLDQDIDETRTPPAWPTPVSLPDPFVEPVSPGEQHELFQLLESVDPPLRDDIELARLYGGWNGVIVPPPSDIEVLQTGTIEEMTVLKKELNVHETIQVELLAVGDHAYHWFDTSPASVRPTASRLAEVSTVFDRIYELSVDLFGSEGMLGVDGDPRLYVVNASPLTLCDVTPETASQCGLAGYFDHSNNVPPGIDPASNGHDMFVLNGNYFESDYYFSVMAHELRHMIEHNQDPGEIDWVAEGSAVLAEELNGFPGSGVRRANIYLSNPDQQVNRWTDGDATPHYGQAFLLNRYIYDRLGPDFYRQLSLSQKTGLDAIDDVAQLNGLDISGSEIWREWLVSLAIHERFERGERFYLDVSGLDTVSMTHLIDLPANIEETVNQLAADYYKIETGETIRIDFDGSSTVPLIGAAAASGNQMWLADRANFRHMHLSRRVDLRHVDSATLSFSVYHDIEAGYDFAYVFVSEDDGLTWQPLVSDNMAGTDVQDDPSVSALTDRFYTGFSGGWLQEEFDLSPYAGKQIMIRVAYVTDLIHTLGGIALDNISIPEIDFYDDAEELQEGWMAHGFERIRATIPQTWHLQLISFPDGDPHVQKLQIDPVNSLSLSLTPADSGGDLILIIGASAPMTLEPAPYRLKVTK